MNFHHSVNAGMDMDENWLKKYWGSGQRSYFSETQLPKNFLSTKPVKLAETHSGECPKLSTCTLSETHFNIQKYNHVLYITVIMIMINDMLAYAL